MDSVKTANTEGFYGLNDFVAQTQQKDRGQGKFELEGARFLEVNMDGKIWMKVGAMVAYLGNITFGRESALSGGLGMLVKRAVSGETMTFSYAEGKGKLYLADGGKKINIIKLNNEGLYVQGNDLMAFEDTVKYDIKVVKKMAGYLAGGLFCVKVEGTGMVAITTHYEPLTLKCTPGNPVFTDPNATVAWSGNIYPEIKIDTSFKTLMRGGSGETVQYKFDGDGFVIIQPFEEIYYSQASS